MSRYKLQHLEDSITEDMQAIIDHRFQVGWHPTTTTDMNYLLRLVSYDRAYDDSHPAFVAGRTRTLPFDGREYCFYYQNGANDTHLQTLLRRVKERLHHSNTAAKGIEHGNQTA